MPYSAIEKQRILLQAKRALGRSTKLRSSASDKRIFIDSAWIHDLKRRGRRRR